MTKIKNLKNLYEKREEITSKENKKHDTIHLKNKIQIKVAMATCSVASGAKNIMDFIINELEKRNIDAVVTKTGCMGYCYAEPTVEVTIPGMDPVIFGYVDEKKADMIIEKYVKSGEFVDGIIPVNYEPVDNS